MNAPGTPNAPDRPTSAGAAGRAPYGPQTPAVRRFLQRFAALAPAEWDAAAAAYAAAAGSAAAVAADRDLQRAVERAGRAGERDAVLGPLAQLVGVGARDGAPEGSGGDSHDADPPAELHPVAEASLAALLALVVRDVLPARAFAALYAPFEASIPVASLGP